MQENILTLQKHVKTKKETTAGRLRELIYESGLKEGEKLPGERDLAEHLKVSRNLLREAILVLCSEGTLEVKNRLGIFVKNPIGALGESLQSIQALPGDFLTYQLEVRTVICVPAARLAALRRTDDDIRNLRQCYRSFIKAPYGTPEECVENGKWEALLHSLETQAAHNPILSRINESVNALVEKSNSLLHPQLSFAEGWISHIQQQHKGIIKAIVDRDAKTAGDILARHMTESVEAALARHPELKLEMPPSFLFN